MRDDADEFFLSTETFSATFQLLNSLGLGGLGAELLRITPVYNHDTHCFDFTYLPQRGGLYQLNVTYRYWFDDYPAHLYGSPFTYIVPAKSVTYGPAATIEDKILGEYTSC